LYDWYKKYIVHGKLTVCIAGNADTEEVVKILETLSEHTEQKPENGLFDSVFSVPHWHGGKKMLKAPFLQEQIFLLYPIKPYTSNHQMVVQNVFNAIVGDTMSSRLFQRLRETGGYSYNVYSYFNMFADCGYWCAYASASKEKTFSVISDMQEELKKLLTNGITESELEGARQHLCGEEIIAGEDMENHVKRMIRSYVNKMDYVDTEKLISDIMSVTKEDVSSFIEELLNNKNFALILYGPKKSKMELNKI
jgi:predicted Zn-dependent peptidase